MFILILPQPRRKSTKANLLTKVCKLYCSFRFSFVLWRRVEIYKMVDLLYRLFLLPYSLMMMKRFRAFHNNTCNRTRNHIFAVYGLRFSLWKPPNPIVGRICMIANLIPLSGFRPDVDKSRTGSCKHKRRRRGERLRLCKHNGLFGGVGLFKGQIVLNRLSLKTEWRSETLFDGVRVFGPRFF